MDDKHADKPPYVPYSSFKSFLVKLKASTIPPRIDRSMLKGMAGDAQTQMRAGLRYMGAVSGDDFLVTDRLRQMVSAVDSDRWKDVFAPIVEATYAPLIGDLDVEAGTAQQLEEKFREVGLNGSSRVRAIRFYLTALEEIGRPYSPFFRANAGKSSVASRNAGATRSKRPRPKEAKDVTDADIAKTTSQTPPEGVNEYALPLPGKLPIRLWLPSNLTADEWQAVNGYLSAVLGLAKPAH